MKFVKDTSKVRSKETGAYNCTITKAYVRKSQSSSSESMHLDVVTDKGQFASIDLWYLNKDGIADPKSVAISQINDLQVLLEIEELESKEGKVNIYDYDLKEETDQVKMLFPDLLNREIGCLFEVVTEPHYKTGLPTQKTEFRQFYDSETMASAGEFLSGAEPESVERYLNLLLENKHIIKQPSNQPNEPVKEPYPITEDDFDDIPF